jgi:integrase
MRRTLKKHFIWTTALARVTRYDVQTVLDSLAETPSEANHAFKYLRTFYLWCIRRGLLDHSPIAAMKMPFKETTRERTLSDEELSQIWNHLKDDTFSTIVKLLFLSGQRRTEVQHLVIDGDMAKLPGQHAKNRARTPLSASRRRAPPAAMRSHLQWLVKVQSTAR